jgi:phosphate transport system substrate-binding protein
MEEIPLIRNRRWASMLALLLTFALFAAACGDDDDTAAATDGTAAADGDATNDTGSDDGGDGELSGSVNLDGSSTVGPLSEVAAELFMAENPGVQVSVAISGTGGGFEKFCAGETDGNNASREISDEEIELCESNDIAFDNVQVANDALSAVVHPDFPEDCATPAQLQQIWDEGGVSSWSEVEGWDLPDESITLFGPGSDSGTFDFFTEVINGEEGQIRNDYQDIGEDDQAAVLGVSGDPWSMAYIPFSFVQEAGDQVKPLAIDDGDGCKEASLDNVQAGEYTPLGRPLFLYASDSALQRPEVVAFFEFYVNNQGDFAEQAAYVPMNDDQIEEALEKVATLAGG